MMPTQPQPTPAPIHDIVGPVGFFPYPLWMVALVALGVCAVIGLIIWLIMRKRPPRLLTAKQRALQAIADLRREGPEAEPYAFGVRVSDALRTYIRDQHGLDAVTRTSVEFLETLRTNPAFSEDEKVQLSTFLESVDMLKYARHEAPADEIQSLLDTAEKLVLSEEAKAPGVGR